MRTRFSLTIVACLMILPLSGCGFFQHKVVLVDDTAISCSGGPVIIDVLANDTIGSKVTINSVTIPTLPVSQGSAVVNTDNTITFTPDAGATGESTFEYQVCYTKPSKNWKSSSTEETCKTAQVTVYLRTSDSAPTAGDDTATTPQNVAVLIDVLENDTDPDSASPGGAGLKITDVTTPDQGTAAIEDSKIRYTPPDATFSGDATFQYTITDSCGNTATASVVVTVQGAAAATRVASSSSRCQLPAKVLLVNSSNFEITVTVGGKQVDVVQPLGSTVVPAKVTSGNDQAVEVEALLPDPDPARVTTTTFSFAPKGRYTITYTDDNVNPAAISIVETP
ncbi:MAG: cadherin-like domain-containing protein [Planctomycetes bacterium]|nr:cadherin-like domain-containing protein [Planctomycetota bacterium]